MSKTAWLENFSAYLTLFTNHPILWIVIATLLLSLAVLNHLIERRERRALAKEGKEQARFFAFEKWKKKMSPDHHLEQEEDLPPSSSRWTIQTEVKDSKDHLNQK